MSQPPTDTDNDKIHEEMEMASHDEVLIEGLSFDTEMDHNKRHGKKRRRKSVMVQELPYKQNKMEDYDSKQTVLVEDNIEMMSVMEEENSIVRGDDLLMITVMLHQRGLWTPAGSMVTILE